MAAAFGLTGAALTAQEANQADPGPSIDAYRDRMMKEAQADADARRSGRVPQTHRWLSDSAAAIVVPVAQQSSLPQRESLLTQPGAASQPAPAEVLAEIPEPADSEQVFAERLDRLVRSAPREMRIVNNYKRVIEKARTYVQRVRRTQPIRLSLAECIQRTLANNYSIRVEAFTPAISQTQLVQAEAAFDSVFFLDATSSRTDQKGATIDLEQPQVDGRTYSGGIRKLLPTGMTVETSLGQTFSKAKVDEKQNTAYNPAYDTTFAVQFSQPLLRGFGLDYNRAPINVRKLDVRINKEQFLIQVRDRLFDVERAYWQLSQSRRLVMILAETTAQNAVTYENTEARSANDASPIEVNNSLSRWRQAEVEFARAVKTVKDAEDVLKNLMNDPDFLLSQDVEIVTTETPFVAPMAIDQFAEVRSAIDERSEIRQAKLAIEQGRINTARAKNETMPRLDVSFRYEVQGLRGSADSSFDLMTANRYNSYAVQAILEIPIGNRQRMASLREAELREQQSIERLRQVMDGVVQDVNNAVRELNFNYESIPTQHNSVTTADLSLRAFQERIDRVDPNTLQTELSQIENLGNTRARLAQLVVDYNIAISNLERAKGTLLRYNNVVIADEKHRP
ncbi:MAG: TolC family protein [Planctomycetes bacterium]|nr:TolC family protein [Planctomycetota bacterium]